MSADRAARIVIALLVVSCWSPMIMEPVLARASRWSPQRAVAFDVASIKPNASSAPASSLFPLGPGDAYVRNGGLFSATNQPLIAYVRFALKAGPEEIPGLPAWAYTERFDIEARTPGSPTKDQMRQMMMALLRERFSLMTHTEIQMKPAFNLVVLKAGHTGPQLQAHAETSGSCAAELPAQPGGFVNVRPAPPTARSGPQLPEFPCGSVGPIAASSPERSRIGGRAVTLERIAGYFTNPYTGIDRPVFDHTGLKGVYDFSIEWALPGNSAQPAGRPEDAEPTFLQALEEQLGLTLKATRTRVPILIVDHIDRPSAN